MSTLYIASRIVSESAGFFEHLYIVYDPDADPNNGNELILRAGPVGVPYVSNIVIESPFLINDSLDELQSNDDVFLDREYTVLNVTGMTATQAWDAMVAFARSMGTASGPDANGNYTTLTSLTYNPTNGPNSNSFVSSILNIVGLDLRDQMPFIDGNTSNSRFSPLLYPGHMNVLDGSGNSNFAIFAYDGQTTTFHKQGGSDVLIVKAGGEVELQNAVNNGFTTITLEGISRAQAVFGAAGDDLTLSVASNEIVRIEDYQTTGATIGAEFRFTDAVYQRGTDAANSFNPHSAGAAYVYEGFDGSDIYYIDLASGFANAHTIIETIADGDDDTLVINGAGAGITWGDVMVLEDSVAGIWHVTLAGHPAFGATIVNVDAANDTFFNTKGTKGTKNAKITAKDYRNRSIFMRSEIHLTRAVNANDNQAINRFAKAA